MKYDFVIGCLPRSGSAWLANTLNMHPDVFCVHEGIGKPPCFDQNRWSLTGSVGSDAFMNTEYDLDHTILFYLDRSSDASAQSLAKAGVFSLGRWKNIIRARDEWVDKFNPIVLDYDNLDMAVNDILCRFEQSPIPTEKLVQARQMRVVSLLYPDGGQ